MKRQISKSDWLRYHHFSASPFDGLQAEVEFDAQKERFLQFFVTPKVFEQVLADEESRQHILLFAEAGAGKSACRLVAEDMQHRTNSHTLVVSHTNLAQVIAFSRSGKEEVPGFHHHLYEILGQIISAFTKILVSDEKTRDAASLISASDRKTLSVIFQSCHDYLNSAQRSILERTGIWKPEQDIKQTESFKPEVDSLSKMLQCLKFLVNILQSLGIKKIYIFVDGVNAVENAKLNSLFALDILKPILSNIDVFGQQYGIFFKFFLPLELKSFLQADKEIDFGANTTWLDLSWSSTELGEILNQRLAAYLPRAQSAPSLDDFCAPELKGKIQPDLLETAKGNPRQLLKLCAKLLAIHCGREYPENPIYWFTKQDWQETAEWAGTLNGTEPVFNRNYANREDLFALIKAGENSQVEFKASVRWDYREQRVNKVLETIIAKSIAGMLNSNGGLLLIGVADNGEILGLEPDRKTLKSDSLDFYELTLTNILKDYIGLEYSRFVQFHFVEIDKKTICVCLIQKSAEPVFMKSGNDFDFWVRTGNSTRALNQRASHTYINQTWKPR